MLEVSGHSFHFLKKGAFRRASSSAPTVSLQRSFIWRFTSRSVGSGSRRTKDFSFVASKKAETLGDSKSYASLSKTLVSMKMVFGKLNQYSSRWTGNLKGLLLLNKPLDLPPRRQPLVEEAVYGPEDAAAGANPSERGERRGGYRPLRRGGGTESVSTP